MVPLADMLTPNQFELELLTGCRVGNQQSAVAACNKLHDAGVPSVVRTTTPSPCLHPSVLTQRRACANGAATSNWSVINWTCCAFL